MDGCNWVLSLLTCYLIIINPKPIKSNKRKTNHDGRKQRAGARLLPNHRTPQPLTTACLHTAARIKAWTCPQRRTCGRIGCCAYIACMQTEMLIFTGCRFLRGQLAVRNWNAYHTVHNQPAFPSPALPASSFPYKESTGNI